MRDFAPNNKVDTNRVNLGPIHLHTCMNAYMYAHTHAHRHTHRYTYHTCVFTMCTHVVVKRVAPDTVEP